jgi:hypothetical protein
MAHSTTPDHRLAWRIAEFTRATGTSRCTLWRMAKRGDVKLIYVGNTPLVPRSEMVRLGLVEA